MSTSAFPKAVGEAVQSHRSYCRKQMRMHAEFWRDTRKQFPQTAAWALEQAIWWRKLAQPFEHVPNLRRAA